MVLALSHTLSSADRGVPNCILPLQTMDLPFRWSLQSGTCPCGFIMWLALAFWGLLRITVFAVWTVALRSFSAQGWPLLWLCEQIQFMLLAGGDFFSLPFCSQKWFKLFLILTVQTLLHEHHFQFQKAVLGTIPSLPSPTQHHSCTHTNFIWMVSDEPPSFLL